MNNILFRNVRIVDANKDFKTDLLVSNGVISKIDENIEIEHESINIVDGNGYVLMPSFIDLHTHLRDPGLTHKEDLETGQKAALRGGFTVLCPMANTKPVCDNKEVMEYVLNKAKDLDLCDIKQVCAITKNLDGQEMIDIEPMRKYTDLFSDDGYTLFNEEIMENILRLSSELDFKVLTHCQPEYEIVQRDLKMLKEVGGNLHICHISLEDTLNEIKKYKDEGHKFTCEVGPHHIYGYGLDYKVNPSFAKEEDMKALIQGIKDGYIDMIGTDHAPHTEDDKKAGSPGISNIEVAFSMVNKVFKENNISLNKLSEMMSANPAKLLGLSQGLIEEGLRADLVLIDENEIDVIDTRKFVSKGKNNPFNNQKVIGKVIMTIRDGKIAYKVEGDM
ncbi:dihydroorotase [Romboutsia ilealis]|uniref:Dihydroorotase n=1 Tax=Romboutsia faecis TaxID=2764597 RepID=A0ABR7JS92_9FIRM|nr:dihydroorotase [Romboutsia faecis]MBC5997787.1 dihydroorotase [Romboutsia faecis]MRN25486.1 dihydroorotase [Romboutsia ilealis]